MTDFTNQASGLDSPATRVAAVTPNDSTDLAWPTRGVYLGGGGDLAVITTGGDTETIPSIPSGFIFPVRATRILATGTTATGIVALS